MFKVAYSCKYHAHSVFIAIIDGKIILHGSSRLNNGIDSF